MPFHVRPIPRIKRANESTSINTQDGTSYIRIQSYGIQHINAVTEVMTVEMKR